MAVAGFPPSVFIIALERRDEADSNKLLPGF